MARLLVSDSGGFFTVDIETTGAVLGTALDEQLATPVLTSAMTLALAALAEGGTWPQAVLNILHSTMADMQQQLASVRFM